MPLQAADWYDNSPDVSQLLQGDVLDGVPVVFGPPVTKRWIILRPTPQGTPIEQAESGLPKTFRADVAEKFSSAWQKAEELVLARASVSRIMIVSQSCDVEWRKHVQVAPVEQIAVMQADTLEHLRDNDVGYWFYLPAWNGLPESYADLSRTTAVHASYFRTDALTHRLTSLARVELQKSLADLYGRPFGFNARDAVPQTAEYGCMSCFVTGHDAPRQRIEAQGNFPHCPGCGEKALWVKLP
jgi:hypothetical protein